MRNKIQSIQNLRGFAALAVLIHHIFLDTRSYGSNSFLINNFYNLEYFGNIGVDIFFIISGFIMVFIHGNDFLKPHAVSTFLLKRIVRVIPLYWLLTTVATFFLFFFPNLFGAGKTFEIFHTIASFLFIPWTNTAGGVIPIIAPGWTLNYEMYFYLVFALFLFFPKYVFIPLITLYFAVSVALHVFVPSYPYLQMITNPLLLEFLFGVYIGTLYSNKKLIKQYYWLLVVSMILFFSNMFLYHDIAYRMIYFGIPSALLLYALISYEYYRGFPLCGNKLLFLGTISYSLYISHVFIYKFIIKVYLYMFGTNAIDFMILLSVIGSIVGAIVIYNFIEKPMTIYFTNKYIKKR